MLACKDVLSAAGWYGGLALRIHPHPITVRSSPQLFLWPEKKWKPRRFVRERKVPPKDWICGPGIDATYVTAQEDKYGKWFDGKILSYALVCAGSRVQNVVQLLGLSADHG